MEDINYNELFGLEEGEKETETAEPSGGGSAAPSTQESAEGEKAQEVADPDVADDSPAQQTEVKQAEGGETKGQTPEENAAFAAARRKAEQERDAAIEQAKQQAAAEAQRTINEAVAKMGLTNPYTKKPITNKAEFDAYQEQYEQEKRSRILKKTGMTDDEFKSYVDSLPEMQEAKQAAEEARQAQAEAKVNEQLKEIAALDPSIKTLEDLTKMPDYEKFYDCVKRGMTLTEAYKLTHYDALTKGAAAASRQAAINAINSKGHMTTTAARGTGAISVPADVMEQYRAFNPGATDEEIQAHYNKHHKTS